MAEYKAACHESARAFDERQAEALREAAEICSSVSTASGPRHGSGSLFDSLTTTDSEREAVERMAAIDSMKSG